ncbi:transposase, partial [Megasphaera indica]
MEEVMPLLKDRQVLLLFDSWYAKSPLIERVLQYPHLAFICNVRSDSAMYELPPLPSGKPGRPKKRGKRIHMDDFNLSWDMDGMKVGHRVVLTHICGNRRIHAYVSCTASGSRRLFFST